MKSVMPMSNKTVETNRCPRASVSTDTDNMNPEMERVSASPGTGRSLLRWAALCPFTAA
jgi:hypothetical protein